MRKEKWEPTKEDVLCSVHFTDDQFIDNDGFRMLKTDAIPSIFEILASPKVCKLSYKNLNAKNWLHLFNLI